MRDTKKSAFDLWVDACKEFDNMICALDVRQRGHGLYKTITVKMLPDHHEYNDIMYHVWLHETAHMVFTGYHPAMAYYERHKDERSVE